MKCSRILTLVLLAFALLGIRNAARAQAVIGNPSFETPTVSNFVYPPGFGSFIPTGGFWTFTGTSGIAANGSAFGNANAPDGTQVAILQGSSGLPLGKISQSVNFSPATTYVMTVSAAGRPGYGWEPVQFSVDGVPVGTPFTPGSTNFGDYTVPFTVTGGYHIIAFAATDSSSDKTTFIDNVRLYPVQIGNPSFETPSVAGASYNPTGGAWTFTGTSGIAANGSGFGNPTAPDGTQVAILQGNLHQGPVLGNISQSVYFSAGTYVITVSAAGRPNYGWEPVQFSVDGINIGATFTPTSSTYYTVFNTVPFTVMGGYHTIEFAAIDSSSDKTTFIDYIGLSKVQPVYFEGADNQLWEIFGSGAKPAHASSSQTLTMYGNNTPVVFNGYVYYTGVDQNGVNNALMRYDPVSDTPPTHLGFNSTSAPPNPGLYAATPPCVTLGYVYYQGTDNKLYKADLDGNLAPQWNPNLNPPSGFQQGVYSIYSPPIVYNGHLYFQGANNALTKTDTNGNNPVVGLGGQNIGSTPFIYHYQPPTPTGGLAPPPVEVLYVQIANGGNNLAQMNLDGSQEMTFSNIGLFGSPFVASTNSTSSTGNPLAYFQGTDNVLREYYEATNTQRTLTPTSDRTVNTPPAVVDNSIWDTFGHSHGVISPTAGWNAAGGLGGTGGGGSGSPVSGVSQADGLGYGVTVVHPHYQVYSVRYAPPGTDIPKVIPSVDYTAESGSSVTNDVTQSTLGTTSLQFSFAASDEVQGIGGSAQFTYSNENSHESSQTATTGNIVDNTLYYSNPRDGIDHDYDQIWLIMNPEADVLSSNPDTSAALFMTTTLDNTDPAGPSRTPTYQYITVSALKQALNTTQRVNGKIVTVPGVQPLAGYTFTQTEIKQMLSQDPFANAPGVPPVVTYPTNGSPPSSAPIDANRYTKIGSIPYDRAADNQFHGTAKGMVFWDDSNFQGVTSTTSYEVSASISYTDGNEAADNYGKITLSDSFTYTYSTTHSTGSTTGYSIAYIIYNPSANWPTNAPDTVYIYLDQVYNTIMFSFIAPQ